MQSHEMIQFLFRYCVFTKLCCHLSCLFSQEARLSIHLWSQLSRLWNKCLDNMTNNILLLPITHTRLSLYTHFLGINNWSGNVGGTYLHWYLLCSTASRGKKLFLEFIFLFRIGLQAPFFLSCLPPEAPTPNPIIFPLHVCWRSWKISCHICHLSRSVMNSFDLSLGCLWPLSSRKES